MAGEISQKFIDLAGMWITTLLVTYYMNVNLYALYAQSFMISCLREFSSFNILRYDSREKLHTSSGFDSLDQLL